MHRFALLVALTLICSLAAVRSEEGLPKTPAGTCMVALLDVVTRGDETASRAFVSRFVSAEKLKQRPLPEWLSMLQRLHDDIGTHKLVDWDAGSPHQITASVIPNGGGPVFTFRLQTAEAEPHQLASLAIEAGGPGDEADEPEAAPAARSKDDAEWLQRARAAWQQQSESGFSGVVLIARGDKVLWHAATGLADREAKTPISADTKFNVGSINKSFTRVAIAQLLAAGKLSLQDTVAKWLPQFSNPAAGKITIGQLLAHRSGLGDIFGPQLERGRAQGAPTLTAALNLYADQELWFEPGSQKRYSNLGYLVLGAIVEKASGLSFDTYLKSKIFEPAGMSGAIPWAADPRAAGLARGYTQQGAKDDQLQPSPFDARIYWAPAGSSYMRAADLHAFVRALVANKLLAPSWTAWFFSSEDAAPPGSSQTIAADANLGIAGGLPGHNAGLEYEHGNGVLVIVAGNVDPPRAEDLAVRLMRSAPRH
jgi:CubicO group peptidase (beta-lactamase class C family)